MARAFLGCILLTHAWPRFSALLIRAGTAPRAGSSEGFPGFECDEASHVSHTGVTESGCVVPGAWRNA